MIDGSVAVHSDEVTGFYYLEIPETRSREREAVSEEKGSALTQFTCEQASKSVLRIR